MLKEKRNTNGITLIALVITIIVLLILAAVTINALSGDNGILRRATEAGKQNTIAQEKEAIGVAYSSCLSDDNIGGVTSSQLQEELQKIIKNVEVSESGTDLSILFTDTSHRYTLGKSGQIEKEVDLTPEEANRIVQILSVDTTNKNAIVLTADNTVKYVEIGDLKEKELSKVEIKSSDTEKIVSKKGIRKSFENCFVDNDGKVYTWGENYDGELGNGKTDSTIVPICISDIEGNELKGKNIVDIVKYGFFKVALDDNGKVYTWGSNVGGQLGNGTENDSSVPICISDTENSVLKGKNIKNISVNGNTVCALDDNGKVYIWGENNYGQLGNGTTTNSSVPICISDTENSVLKGKNIKNISANGYTVCAIDDNGKVYTWGENERGQLGNGTKNDSSVPICISDTENSVLKGKNIKNISVNGNTVCALDDNGKVYIWGENNYGQLGNGTTTNSSVPICISDTENSVLKGKNIKNISANGYTVCAIDDNGKVYTWGENNYGQLGNGTTTNSSMPICISDVQNNALNNATITKIITMSVDIYAIDDNGKLYAWGENDYGQLGNGTTTSSNVPICMNDVTGSKLKDREIAGVYFLENQYENSTIALLDSNKRLYLFGTNNQGQLLVDNGDYLPSCISDEKEVLKEVNQVYSIIDGTDTNHFYLTENGDIYNYSYFMFPQ